MSTKELAEIVERQPQPEEVEYYYDSHPTKEDLMGESTPQFELVHYLISVLKWLYRKEGWFVTGNINIYHKTRRPSAYPIAPDVAVFKGVVLSPQERRSLRSWKMLLPNRPAPTVVFEISSDETWKNDLVEKPVKYQKRGIQEYFAYDPNDPPVWRKCSGQLRGWRYNPAKDAETMEELTPNEQGWLWSNELDSWLVPDGAVLRLYDVDFQLRLTKDEHGDLMIEQKETEVEQAQQKAEQARQETTTERTAKELAQQQAEAERAAKEAAWAKLRELGIDPEKL
jgi:Uma2 family endonuclease